ncbi:MAG TPA: hypothetical protein VNO21_24390 [Polyangiaceae bacterium]|nr:hypothetical protein [Polyangiaceae bacterium]
MNPSLATLQDLLKTADLPELGPRARADRTPESELHRKLDAALHELEAPRSDLIRALVLLWHDHLDAAHEIAQRIETPDGSFLHGIMHRREPDYANAKYWFRRVGDHPCFGELARRARVLLNGAGDAPLRQKLISDGHWSAFAFIDACEAEGGHPGTDRAKLLRELQKIEFELLLEHLATSR